MSLSLILKAVIKVLVIVRDDSSWGIMTHGEVGSRGDWRKQCCLSIFKC